MGNGKLWSGDAKAGFVFVIVMVVVTVVVMVMLEEGLLRESEEIM